MSDSDSDRDDAGEEADRLRSEIIKSSGFDDDVQSSLQYIKETSSSEEELGITPAVAAGAASASAPPPSLSSASASAPLPASTVPTSAPAFTSISASSPPSALISASSPVEATEGGVAPDVLVNQLFKEFTARRAGMVIAVTSGFESLYKRCVSTKDELCLFGLLDKSWDVSPINELPLPPQIPKPTSGISDNMDVSSKKEWRQFVVHWSDKWLSTLRIHMGDQLDVNSRVKLFGKIDELQSIQQVVKDLMSTVSNKPTKQRSSREEDSSAGSSKKARMM